MTRKRTIETLTITRVVEEDSFPTARETIDTTAEPASERRVRIDTAMLPPAMQRLAAWNRRALP